MSLSNLTAGLGKFHRDEDGLEAVQVVMIVSIAALILIGTMTFGQEIFNWANETFDNLKNESIEGTGSAGA